MGNTRELRQKWARLPAHKRKLYRRSQDWQHNKSPLNLGDIDELYDDLCEQDIYLTDNEMLRQVIRAAHATSDLILGISPEIWFSMRENHD